MTGENDLTTILKTLRPSLNPGEYVFCTVAELVVAYYHDHN